MSDVLVVGAPSVLAAWTHALVRDVAGLLDPPIEVRMLDRTDDAEFLGEQDSGPSRIFLCHFPSPSLIKKVAAGVAPCLALLDHPADSVRFLHAQRNAPFFEEIRAHTLSHTIDRALYDNSSVLIVFRGMELAAQTIVDHIVDCLGVELDPAALAALKERHGCSAPTASLEDALEAAAPLWAPLDEIDAHMSKEDQTLVAKILAPLFDFVWESKPRNVIWPREFFFFGDTPNTPVPVMVDLTGGARVISYGPYAFLPPGSYRVTFLVGLSDDSRSMPFSFLAIQHQGATTVAQARWKSPGGGIFEGSFQLEHVFCNEPLEIVLRCEEGAIEGRLALVQISFELLETEAAEVRQPELLEKSG